MEAIGGGWMKYIYIKLNKKEQEETKLIAGPGLLIKTFRQFCLLQFKMYMYG